MSSDFHSEYGYRNERGGQTRRINERSISPTKKWTKRGQRMRIGKEGKGRKSEREEEKEGRLPKPGVKERQELVRPWRK
jgi:hypothetical protein